MAAAALSLLLLADVSPVAALTTTFIPAGSVWHYLDDGSNQGSAWRVPGPSDPWAMGPAQLGYGDMDEATVVGFGPDAGNKYVTTYFRTTFNVFGAASYPRLDLRLVRDDGAVVYLNGTEIYRSNMPGGSINYLTAASSAIAGADESAFQTSSLFGSPLVEGTNSLAVEIHQFNGTSTDISFDFELIGSNDLVTRGPYLQLGTATSIVVRWRTLTPTDSRVRYGASPGSLTQVADDGSVTTEHVVTLNGLSPDSAYYYSIGSSSTTLRGGDSNHTFTTAPVAGQAKATRVWVVGDSGTADANAQAVRDAYDTFAGPTDTNLWLMLGDNAYNSGTDAEYQAALFDMYPARLRTSVLWPTLGNHDGVSADSATQSGPYYDMFTLPTLGQAGGVASGTEAYYSFDYGNIHFICLDSQETDRSAGGAMLTWLDDDLMASNADWLIAFWHHPPYSKGSHNSDTEVELMEMRQNALPILESHGVDLVLTGHSHSYERSILLDGHYGLSTTLTGAMILDGGDGRLTGNGAYSKTTLGPAPHEGAVYVVAGSSGQTSAAPLDHPVMYVSLLELGSVVLDVNHNVLRAKFVSSTGAIDDNFTIIKGGPLCGNGLKEVAEACDQTDLAGASCAAQGCSGGSASCTAGCTLDYSACTGCGAATSTPTVTPSPTPTPTIPSHHDTVLVPVTPINVTIPASASEVLKTIRVAVRNADIAPSKEVPGHVVRLTVLPGDCPGIAIDGLPDFDSATGGDQDTALVAGGRTRKAKVRLRLRAGDFPNHNRVAPRRCTLQLSATADVPGNQDPTADNNSVPVEINVIVAGNTSSAWHESILRSARPVKLTIRRTATSAVRSVSVPLIGADISPVVENPGHPVILSVDEPAGTCPPGAVTVTLPDTFVPDGGMQATGHLAVSVDAGAFVTASAKSPDRCVAVLKATTAVAGNVEPDATNNTTRLVIDVNDKTDY